MKGSLLLIILMIFSITEIVFGQEINSVRFDNVVKNLKLNKAKIKTELYAEKKLPNSTEYIMVIPILLYEDEGSFSVQNYILITDESGKIDIKFTDEVVDSDAITLTDIIIDTGYYNLNEKTRAFGIRHHFTGQSKANPYGNETISLFYPSGKTLKKGLNRYELNSYSGEWDTRCAGRFEDKESSILVLSEKNNSFADLKVKTTMKIINNKEYKDECLHSETSKITYKTLKFSHGIYK